ncbi:MAG: thiamine phosphate synthase [candidate division Zixibacteria bacterium]|nr:thiamine phosphate synthase [candidate division Zixibacteria bacterium]
MKSRITKPSSWKLYVITDEVLSRGRTHQRIAEVSLKGGAYVIQLRDKKVSGKMLFEVACEIRELTRRAGVPFIVNDRVDIAIASGADGVHVGQDDLPAKIARELIGDEMILGVSAITVDQAIQAEQDGADYIGFGPVYEARGTKSDAGEPLGLKLLREACSQCSIPVIAIGGINKDNVSKVIKAGAYGAAVISAIVASEDIERATFEIKSEIESAEGTN